MQQNNERARALTEFLEGLTDEEVSLFLPLLEVLSGLISDQGQADSGGGPSPEP